MPVTNISLLRSAGKQGSGEGPTIQPSVGTLPFYSVLFWYSPDGRWDSTNYGVLDDQFFRRYTTAYLPDVKYNDPVTGAPVNLVSNPLIRCYDSDTDWKINLGRCYSPLLVGHLTPYPYATYLEVGGKHTPKTDFPRSSQPLGYGIKTGDTASTTAKYYSLQTAHAGHFHSVNTAINALVNINWGELKSGYSVATSAEDYNGTQSIAVDLVLRDPKLTGGTQLIQSLPKGVIVFGADLPSPDYTSLDERHRSTATGLSAPLLAKGADVGVIGSPSFLSFRSVSNTSGQHTHASTPVATQSAASVATGQTAYVFNTPPGTAPSTTSPGVGFGAHIHNIEYRATLTLKSKELRAYITTLDQTPIADGIIIGYNIGVYTGYTGTEDGPSALPPGWYFCDGTNGTPDLRGYFINANFRDSSHDVELAGASSLTLAEIDVEPAGAHGHAGPPFLDGNFSGTDKITSGLGTATDIGAHGYDVSTNHSHAISSQSTFIVNGVTYRNYRVGTVLDYTPPTIDLAFIQYNAP